MGVKNYTSLAETSVLLANRLQISKQEADKMIRAFVDTMKEQLHRKDKEGIQFINFITIEKVFRKQKIGRNPKNPAEEVIIPAKHTLKVKVSEAFQKELNSDHKNEVKEKKSEPVKEVKKPEPKKEEVKKTEVKKAETKKVTPAKKQETKKATPAKKTVTPAKKK